MDPIEVGFKYLGFYLKSLKYITMDWIWLVKKFDKRIGHWAHRFLSLGDCLVLIRAVLVGILVYLLSLVLIPVSIMNIIRKKIYYFYGEAKHHAKSFIL